MCIIKINYQDHNKLIEDICTNIKTIRELRGLTQKELAKRIKTSPNVISKIETDGSNLTLKSLHDIIEIGLKCKLEINIKK